MIRLLLGRFCSTFTIPFLSLFTHSALEIWWSNCVYFQRSKISLTRLTTLYEHLAYFLKWKIGSTHGTPICRCDQHSTAAILGTRQNWKSTRVLGCHTHIPDNGFRTKYLPSLHSCHTWRVQCFFRQLFWILYAIMIPRYAASCKDNSQRPIFYRLLAHIIPTRCFKWIPGFPRRKQADCTSFNKSWYPLIRHKTGSCLKLLPLLFFFSSHKRPKMFS